MINGAFVNRVTATVEQKLGLDERNIHKGTEM